jgi:putative membrane protein
MNTFGPYPSMGLVFALAIAGTAVSQTSAEKPDHSDVAFMKQAAENGHAEVESGKRALSKASDPRVREFAQTMVDDHTRSNQRLKALATKKQVELPERPSLLQKGKAMLLDTAEGESFDRRYAESMGVNARRDTLELFQNAASEAQDPEVKAFAQEALPMLQKHLSMAQSLHAALSGSDARGERERRTR